MRSVQSSLYFVGGISAFGAVSAPAIACTFSQPIMWVSLGAHTHPPPPSSRAHKARRRVANRPTLRGHLWIRLGLLGSNPRSVVARSVTSTNTATVTCSGFSRLITDHFELRMDGSPSKRVFTENTLDSRNGVDVSTRNDGYAASLRKGRLH